MQLKFSVACSAWLWWRDSLLLLHTGLLGRQLERRLGMRDKIQTRTHVQTQLISAHFIANNTNATLKGYNGCKTTFVSDSERIAVFYIRYPQSL